MHLLMTNVDCKLRQMYDAYKLQVWLSHNHGFVYDEFHVCTFVRAKAASSSVRNIMN